MQDDYGMSYYYRGTAPNNYVKFGQNAEGQDMWWRIIRFNGDGTIRIQYDGVGPASSNTYTRGFAMTGQVWNGIYNDVKYVGWMFGGANGSASTSREQAQRNDTNSSIKTKVDEWYKIHIFDTGYSDYVADSIFCNDRSIPGPSVTGWTSDSGIGYGGYVTGYGAMGRYITGNSGPSLSANTNPQPKFICLQENDKFTVEETSGGNGSLTYPVGLITADEIVAAGSGKLSTPNQSYYLNKNDWYWSFSPNNFNASFASMFILYKDADLSNTRVYNNGSVPPVINFKAEYLDKLRGNGTIDNPYYLQV